MERLAQQLVLHGSLVLLTGFLGGAFFARAIKRSDGEVAWRVVHSGSSMAGVMLIALAPALPLFSGASSAAQLIAWSLIAGVELFVVGMIWAAISGNRGLSRRGNLNNRIVWLLYMAGMVLTLIGCGTLVYGAAAALYA